MIDLGPVRASAETARSAIEEVDLHAEGGLFGKLPPRRAALLLAFAVGSARNVCALVAGQPRPRSVMSGAGPRTSNRETPPARWNPVAPMTTTGLPSSAPVRGNRPRQPRLTSIYAPKRRTGRG